jgi:predicted RNA polymerase sigma factor
VPVATNDGGIARVTAEETNAAVDAVIRIESARLIAGLAHYTGDVGLAEELAQDAVVAALEQWPDSGVPRNPGAWLMLRSYHLLASVRAVRTRRRAHGQRARARPLDRTRTRRRTRGSGRQLSRRRSERTRELGKRA